VSIVYNFNASVETSDSCEGRVQREECWQAHHTEPAAGQCGAHDGDGGGWHINGGRISQSGKLALWLEIICIGECV
jgi:hypothetical protein